MPDCSINKLKLVFNGTESQSEDSNNQTQTPSQSNINGEEPNEQVDVKTIQRIHGDQNQEIGRVMGFGHNWWHLKKNSGKLYYTITTPTTLGQIGEAKLVQAYLVNSKWRENQKRQEFQVCR